MTNLESRRWQRLTAALAAIAFVLALIGLRGDLATADPTALVSKAPRVTIDHFEFQPATLTVARGSQVAFANTSAVSHTATRNGAFDTGVIKPGKSKSVRFTQTGTFRYHCEIHPLMHGKIVVQ